MIEILPLEQIADKTLQDAYAMVVELYQRRKESKLLEKLCHDSKFNPVSFLVHFHTYRTFTVLQLGFIAGIYQQYASHQKANERYQAGGYREELISLLQDMLVNIPIPKTRAVQGAKGALAQKLKELQEGQPVFSRYFSINPALLDLLPDARKEGLVERLENLTSTYWELFREERSKLTLENIR